MSDLKGKTMVVVGASRGVGAAVAAQAAAAGAEVLGVSRHAPDAESWPDPGRISWMRGDATEAAVAEAVVAKAPDVLVLAAGAPPPVDPLHELDWDGFAVNWETDVKASFLICRAALRRPLAPGATVVLVSSGAAIGGSPISGGYAGAKRTQMFIARYAQRESQRLGLGLRFLALAPGRIMGETQLGRRAIEGYARYLGLSPEQFTAGMEVPLTPDDFAGTVLAAARGELTLKGEAALVTGTGVQEVA
jgi:NAD(P)-dependent dehydrogenase (short-subunit alcohol dehydrogenase family)